MRNHDRDSVLFYGGFMGVVVLLGFIMLATSGCSLFKSHSRPLPDSPFDLTAVAVYSDEINLAWNYLADQHDGFYLYRNDTDDFRKIAVLEADTSSYVDSPLQPETTYSYYMSTYNATGESDPSEIVSALTPPEVELMGYEVTEESYDWSDEWRTRVQGSVKNNTRRPLAVWVKAKLFNYEEVLVVTKNDFLDSIDPLKTGSLWISYVGERIKFVEVWIENYS